MDEMKSDSSPKDEYAPLKTKEKDTIAKVFSAKPPEAGKPQTPPRASNPANLPPVRHDRAVSWDLQDPKNLTQPPIPPRVIKNSNNTGDKEPLSPVTTQVSLKEIMSSNPIEDEAEAYIQQTIESIDPTKTGYSDAQKALLRAVPDSAKDRFEDEAMASDDSKRKGYMDLGSLTKTLTRMQSQRHKEVPEEIDIGGSSGDRFAVQATALLQRAKSNAEAKKEEAAKVVEEFDPMVKWKKIRGVVHASAAANNAATDAVAARKKDDKLEEEEGKDVEMGKTRSSNTTSEMVKSRRAKEIQERDGCMSQFVSEISDFFLWLAFSRRAMFSFIKKALLFMIIPCGGTAALLFYVFSNPPCGTQQDCIESQRIQRNATTNPSFSDNVRSFLGSDRSEVASVSWWLLFLGVRQVVTLMLALGVQACLVDFLALRSKWFPRVFGQYITLGLIQAKGWPFSFFGWACFDFLLLYGEGKFALHWLYFTDIGLFNEENPSGLVLASKGYSRILSISLAISVVVALKRFYIGLILGKATCSRYQDDLKKVMRKALLIGQVATMARDMEKYGLTLDAFDDMHDDDAYDKTISAGLDDGTTASGEKGGSSRMRSLKSSMNLDNGSAHTLVDLTQSQRAKINEMLGAWEEPKAVDDKDTDITIKSIIQFRQSLSCLNTAFPFSVAFGPADTRAKCIESLQKVYFRLLGSQPGKNVLAFDAIALVAMKANSKLDMAEVKELVHLFRPERDGTLSLLDFAKSVDTVYKELRTLRAAVLNSSRIDKSCEAIYNIIFYFIVGCIVLAVMGLDPFVLFASISGFIIGFAFMIGAACSKYFEGMLFILVRRPYDIGDRINISNPEVDTPGTGSPGWIVKDITIFTTTVMYAATSELATYNNGAIAVNRVINMSRSPPAVIWFLLKFPIEAPYVKFAVFKGAIENFMKDRPREWASFASFRSTRVEADLGFIEYIVIGMHRESWGNTGACKQSLADVQSFALELQKKMGMRYTSPPMPVHLSMSQGMSSVAMPSLQPPPVVDTSQGHLGEGDDNRSYTSMDVNAVHNMFRT